MRPGVSDLYPLLASELGLQEGDSARPSVLATPFFLMLGARGKPRCYSAKEMVHVARLCSSLDGFPICASGRMNAVHADIASSRRAMLRYYTVTFAFLLTTNLENNCFLSGKNPHTHM